MELAVLIEPPVLGYSQCRVPGRLVLHVLSAGSPRGYLQDQVGRFALPGDDVSVVLAVEGRVGVERDEHVGGDSLAGRRARFGDDVSFSGDNGGAGVAQVLGEVVKVSVLT